MKRFLNISLGFVFIFLVGCGSKSSNTRVLSCKLTKTVGSALSEQSYKVYFDKEIIEKLSVNINVSLNEPDDVTKSNLESDVSDAFGIYKNRDGVSYSSNVKDDGFTVKLDINFNKLSAVDKANINLINSEKSYDDIKTEFENDGFVCE